MNATIERIWAEPGLDGAWVEAALPCGRVKLYRSAAGTVTVGHGESVEAWADDDVLGWLDECVQADVPLWKAARAVEDAVAEGLRSDPLLRALCGACERAGLDGLASVAHVGTPLVEQAAGLLELGMEDGSDLRAALVGRGVPC